MICFMETTPRWAHLVGGDMSLDFVNTDVVSEHDRSRDVLRSTEEFVAWSAYAQLPGATPTLAAIHGSHGEDLLDEARSLRTATRSVIEAITSGRARGSGPLDVSRRPTSQRSATPPR